MYTSYSYLLLGTNLGEKKNNLESAKVLVNNRIGEIMKKSEIIETEAVGFETKNLFLNQIIYVKTILSPMQLLKETQKIEILIGRKEKSEAENYKDRIIDIDILLFNEIIYKSAKLDIPHYNNMKNRKFVKELFYKLCS